MLLSLLVLLSPIPVYTSPTSHWVNHTSLPSARQEHATVVLDEIIYVLGGVPFASPSATEVPTLDTVLAFSISNDSWSDVSPLPVPLNHANAVAVNGKLYILGSLLGGQIWNATDRCWVYDLTADQWNELPPMPAEQARGASALGVWEDTAIVAGGLKFLDVSSGQLSVDTVSQYNTTSGEWSTLPSLPEARDHFGGVVYDSKMWVIGGRDSGQNNTRNNAWSMELPASNESVWVSHSPMPTARGGLSIGLVGSVIYAFGGEGSQETDTGVFNDTEAYDIESDMWFKLDPMPLPRHGTIAATVNGGVWIPGGGAREGDGAVTRFDEFIP